MGSTTRAISKEEFILIIKTLRYGFKYFDKEGKEKLFKSNNRIATILLLEANLGLRIGDLLRLRLNNIIQDGERYRLDMVEQKTGKRRIFTVPTEIYNYIRLYCYENNISPTAEIFPIGERAVQKQLKIVADYLNLTNISTHSFRKYFATQVYINNNYDIMLVKELLQHSSVRTTQRYITMNRETIEKALREHVYIIWNIKSDK